MVWYAVTQSISTADGVEGVFWRVFWYTSKPRVHDPAPGFVCLQWKDIASSVYLEPYVGNRWTALSKDEFKLLYRLCACWYGSKEQGRSR